MPNDVNMEGAGDEAAADGPSEDPPKSNNKRKRQLGVSTRRNARK